MSAFMMSSLVLRVAAAWTRDVNRSQRYRVVNVVWVRRIPVVRPDAGALVTVSYMKIGSGSANASEQRLDPAGQVLGRERLGDVVVGAGVVAGLHVGLLR